MHVRFSFFGFTEMNAKILCYVVGISIDWFKYLANGVRTGRGEGGDLGDVI